MWWFIKHPVFGYLIGEFHGMAIFEYHLREKIIARPRVFRSKEAAEEYMAGWDFGPSGCFVTDEIPKCYIGGVAA